MASRRAVQALFAAAIFIQLSGSFVAAGLLRAQVLDSTRRDSTPAVLIGRVTDSTGMGLVGAEITLFHAERIRAITGDSGQFRLVGLAPGTSVFNVRRIGFEPASFTAVLRPGRTHRATMVLTASAAPLPTVAVSDTAVNSHWLDAFDRRKNNSRGTFITRAEIVRKGARM